jgi:hypothetical protein
MVEAVLDAVERVRRETGAKAQVPVGARRA